jgi:hypothetical protein
MPARILSRLQEEQMVHVGGRVLCCVLYACSRVSNSNVPELRCAPQCLTAASGMLRDTIWQQMVAEVSSG